MKRIILILWVALVSSGWLMANHWTPNSTLYEDNMTLTGFVRIDGVEQQTTMIEVGAFCGEECRGSARLAFFPPTQHYVVQLLIFGNNGDQLTLKLYDHGQNEELDLIPPDALAFASNGYGSLESPYLLDFYSEPPGPHVVTVSANPVEGGTVSGGGTYEHGATVTLTATANEDYMFVNWTKDDVLVSASAAYSFTVIEAGDYVANFVLGINHHWTPNTVPYEDNMTFTGVVQIDGVEQQTPMLEVGAFCGEECRGSATLTFFEPTQRYVVQLVIYGNGGDPLTFKLYDHELNEELDLYPTNAISFAANGYGSLVNPYVLNFTETPTESYTITATANISGGGTITGTGAYLYGTSCTLTATANENYQFVNWFENGTMVTTSTTYTFDVTSDRSFVANFVPIEGNHWIPNTAPYEDNMTLTGVVLINYVEQQTTALEVGAFCGEECRGAGRLTLFEPTQRYVIQLVVYGNSGDQLAFRLFDHEQNAELDLTPPDAITFAESGYGTLANPYVLNFRETFDITVAALPTEGGTVTGTGTYNYGSTATLNATPNEGYHFVSWKRDDQQVSANANYSFTVTEAADYVANFELNSYEITAVANPEAGGTVTGAGTYDHFSTCTLAATANEGYHFLNWTLDGEVVTTEPAYGFEVTGAADYVANFELNSYEITAVANPEAGGTVTGAGTYDHFSTCTLAATANEGYHFLNWTLDGEVVTTEPAYSFEVTGTAIYVANFELNSYEITATANPEAGGTVTGAGTYDHFSTCTLMATASTGYHFLNWTLDGEVITTEAAYSFEVTGAADYEANFELNSYEITATANPEVGGTVTGAGTYDHFSTCLLTTTTNTGYHFLNWTLDGEVVTTEPAYSFEVTGAADYVANFELNSYEITVTANPEAGGTVTGAGTYDHFSTCTLTATANEGYHFLNWTLDGEVVTTEASYSFEVTGAADYVANFELNSYEITATANPEAGGTVTGAGSYDHFSTCTLTATANTSYHFLNWTLDGEVVTTEASYSFEVTGAANYMANFELNSYEITAMANPEAGGTTTGAGTYDHFSTCTLMATANEGYVFINWTENGVQVSADASYSFTVTGSRSLVANFEEVQPNTYVITAVANPTEGGTVSGSGMYTEGGTCTLTATANTGYHFLNWTLDGEVVTTETAYSFEVTEAVIYVANFELNSYEITAAANPETGGTVTGAGTYDYFSTCTLTATASTGYHFLSWTLDGEVVTTEPAYSFEVTGAASYVANFELNSYEITAEANPETGGTTTGAGTYDHFSTCTLTATANEGYVFINWTENGVQVSADASYSFTVTGSRSLVANFGEVQPNTYVITAVANPTEGGTVSGSGMYTEGGACTLTATANIGYHFLNWTLDGEVVTTEAAYSFEVTGAGSYVANFELNSYEITATANPIEGGTVTGEGNYNHFETCTLTATPNESYVFVNWTLDGEVVSTEATYSFEVTGAASYVANFEQNAFEITATANPEAGGTVEGAGTYIHGETCTLSATANEGYTFVNWTKDGEEVSTDATYNFTVTEAADYVANFELNTYDITVTASPSNGGVVTGSNSYAHGMTATLTATANDNFTFLNWTEDGTVVSANATYSFIVTRSGDYVANFQQNTFAVTVTADPEEGGTVIGGGTFDRNATATVTATANEGYEFLYWARNGQLATEETTYTFTVTEDSDCVAYFALEEMEVQVSSMSGGWTWYNTYIEQDTIDGLEMLRNNLGGEGIQIKAQQGYTSYFEGYGWMGTLSDLDNESSYKVQTSAPCMVNMIGGETTPEQHPITITPGWNWIGYPLSIPMSVTMAFSNINPTNGDQLKAQNGYANYYDGIGWMGTLTTIEPGTGLLYKSNNSQNITLVYPDPEGAKGAELAENVTSDNNHWVPDLHAYPDNMTVTAVVELDDEELQSDSYELAAFANGECRGSVRLMYIEPLGRHIAFLTIAGEEVTTLSFSLYDVATGEEIHVADEQINFSNNATLGDLMEPYVIHFRSLAGMDEFGRQVHVFPNPVSRGANVSLGMTEDTSGEIQVEIINALGAVLSVETSTKLPSSIKAPEVSGVYTLRITVKGKGTCYRKLVVR